MKVPPVGPLGPLVAQGVFFATLYGALRFARLALKPATHPVVNRYPRVVHNDALASCLTELAGLCTGEEERLDAILRKVDDAIQCSDKSDPSLQTRISRLIHEVVDDANALVATAAASSSPDAFRSAVVCETDTIPQLKGLMEDMLWNHLLSRAPGTAL